VPEDCLFCKIANKQIPADLLYEDDLLVAFRDISPQAPTHVLVIPKLHIGTLNDLTEDNQSLIGKMVMTGQSLAKELGISESGFRLVMNCNEEGGQTVFHIHLHILGGRQLAHLG
jgi:histidine triad (HIT) family protein